jgi:hemerythrin-like domain-containing protein
MSTGPSAPAAAPRPARPTRPPVPPLPEFEVLDQTHRAALETLKDFEQLLAHLGEHGPDETARASAAKIMDFFAGPARTHHADEEKLVFPSLLNSSNVELVQHVRRLQQDHGWLDEDWRELAPQIEAIAKGYNWYDLAILQHALPVFTALYHEHIALEETVVYPEAKRARLAELTSRAPKA